MFLAALGYLLAIRVSENPKVTCRGQTIIVYDFSLVVASKPGSILLMIDHPTLHVFQGRGGTLLVFF